MKIKVMITFGTRPEAIKMVPIIKELENDPNFETIICLTGQHQQMLEQVLNAFEINHQINLKVMKKDQTLKDITVAVLEGMTKVLEVEKPDILLVHGDTTTTFAASLAAFYTNTKIGHVEAGLRTYDLNSPYPEEFNRQVTGIIADIHFAPTKLSRDNLIKELKDPTSIYVTGNTAIDTLRLTIKSGFKSTKISNTSTKKLVFVTIHRRENLEKLNDIFEGIKKAAISNPELYFYYPVHLNPKIREKAQKILSGINNVKIDEPIDVFDTHYLLNKSYIVLTDSGGIQEEAASLSKPVLVVRTTTERPEGIISGNLKLIGNEGLNIAKEISNLVNNKEEYQKMTESKSPFGDGTAAKQIKKILHMYFKEVKGKNNE